MTAVSVIIVNYNGSSLLQECLDSLREQTMKDFEVIFVDNASSDGSVEFVCRNYPEVKVIVSRTNLGYGGGNNLGIQEASGGHIVLLNNDTKADPRWLEFLVATAESDPEAGMCASKIMNYYEPETIDNTGLIMYRDGVARGRGRLEKDTGQYDAVEEVFFPSGCAGLYRREMLDQIGALDEDFFLYVDDVDIGLRGRLAGWRCLYAPSAVVYHKYSATTEPYSRLKAYLVERNRIWVVMKYFPLPMAAASICHTFRRYLLQAYGASTGKGAGGRFLKSASLPEVAGTLLRSYGAAFLASGKMLRKRRAAMRLKRVSNREFSRWFDRFGISARELALKD